MTLGITPDQRHSPTERQRTECYPRSSLQENARLLSRFYESIPCRRWRFAALDDIQASAHGLDAMSARSVRPSSQQDLGRHIRIKNNKVAVNAARLNKDCLVKSTCLHEHIVLQRAARTLGLLPVVNMNL
jgi:hypothetical protein